MDGGIVLKLYIRMELYSEGCDQLSACWKCMPICCILHFFNALRLLYCIGALWRSMCEGSIIWCLLCLPMVGKVIIEDCSVSLLNFFTLLNITMDYVIPIDWFFVKSSTPPTSIILRLNCHRKGVKYHYDINFNFKRLAQEKFIRVDLTIMSPPVYRGYFFCQWCISVRLSVCLFKIVSAPYLKISCRIFVKLVSDVHAMEAMCRTHVPTIPVQGQGQVCRSNGRFGRLLY